MTPTKAFDSRKNGLHECHPSVRLILFIELKKMAPKKGYVFLLKSESTCPQDAISIKIMTVLTRWKAAHVITIMEVLVKQKFGTQRIKKKMLLTWTEFYIFIRAMSLLCALMERIKNPRTR